jgi:hypothetical protein
MIAGLVVVAGCADSGSNTVDMDEPIADGIQANFIDKDANIVAFTQFGTFKLVIADQLVEGKYKIITTADGYSLDMTLDNGEVETWSIVITEGKPTAVVDDEGTQYTHQDYIDIDRSEEL